MANFGVTIRERYKKIVEDLWPQGVAWTQIRERGLSIFSQLTCLIASESQHLDERVGDLFRETNPKTTFEMLTDWEEFLELPDDCTPPNEEPSLNDRRNRLCQKLTTGGGQNEGFYQLVSNQLGVTEDIEIREFDDFRVGTQMVGDRLTNGTNASTGWTHTFLVAAPATLTEFFLVGQSTVGERLVDVSNETLECVIDRFKPAHANVIFAFGDIDI